MGRPSLLARYIFVALLCSSCAAFAQKAGVITRFVAPAMVLQPAAKPGLQEVSVAAATNAQIKWHDILQTGDGGRLRAQLNDGSILSLGSKSRLVVTKHDERAQQSQFDLNYGQVRAQVVHLARPDSSFEVRTQTAVCGVLGTDGVFDGSNPIQTVVIVITGVVAVRNSNPNVVGSVTLTAGQFSIIRDGQPPTGAQQANANQVTGAVNGTTGNTTPQPSVTLSTMQVPYGGTFTLNAQGSSGGMALITNYAFSIPSRNFNQTGTNPVLNVDTTNWPAGTYAGTLTIALQDPNDATKTATATAPFQFTIQAPPNPADAVVGLASAYTNLQPGGFSQWFDPAYTGTTALATQLEQAIPSIQALSVTYASPQVSITGNNATCTVNFSFKVTPKPVPPATTSTQFTYTTGSVSLGMVLPPNANHWLINSVVGALGSAGMLSVPGTTSTTGGNSTGSNGSGTGGTLLIPGFAATADPSLNVYSGGSVSGTINLAPQNGFSGTVNISFGPNLPLGITAGTIAPVNVGTNNVAVPYTLSASSAAALGAVSIPYTAIGNGITQSGNITLNVVRLTLTPPTTPVQLFAGSATTVPVGVSFLPAGATGPVTLTATSSDPAVTASLGAISNGTATLTLTSTNSATGASTVAIAANEVPVTATVSVNRIAPVVNVTGPTSVVNVAPGQPATVAINVPFNGAFAGPVTVTAPTISGLSFTPTSITLTQAGNASFQATATGGSVVAERLRPQAVSSGNFTITAGKFSTTVAVSFNVVPVFDFTMSPGAVTVTQGSSAGATVQVTAVPGTGVGSPTVSLSLSGVPAGITASLGTPSVNGGGPVAITVGALPGTAPGNYSFTVNGVAGVSSHSANVTVTVRPLTTLTITANSKSRLYGSANPTLDATYSGFTNGEGPASLTGSLGCSTTAAPNSAVGGYPITCSGQSSPNYTIVYAAGTLSVTPAPLTITANNKSRQFGAANPSFDAAYNGFVLSDTAAVLSGTLSCTSTATATTLAGSYPINCSGQSSANYTITYVPGTLTITGLPPLTITANSKSRTYGAANPTLDASYSGFVGSDGPASLAGTLNCTTTATAASGAGAYPINCSGQSSSSYSIVYNAGTLNVTPAPLTITANSKSITFGNVIPVLDAAYAGFVASDNAASLSGTLSCVTAGTSSSSAGAYPITCSGQTSPNYTIRYVAGTLTIATAGTSTGIASSRNPAVVGVSVTFTATVTPSTATGSVTFSDGSTTLGVGTLSAGQATLTTSALSIATHSISATYSGDKNFNGSVSGTLSQAVTQIPTATAVVSSANPAAFGASVTFTATVTPSTATGTVTFNDGSTPIGTGTLSGGQATFATSALAAGTHAITAVYGGDVNDGGSTSTALSQVVNATISPLSTTTAVVSSLNPSTFGTSVMFTATVTPTAATGTVTFKDGTTSLGTGTIASGQATFSTSALSVATHSITAVYGGDATYSGSTSSAVSQVVNVGPTTSVLGSSQNPATYGASVTFTVLVTPSGASGTVTFKDGSTTLGTGTLSSGQATFSTGALSVATHSITAVYGGDANYGGSTSTAVSQVVSVGPTTTVVTSSLNPSTLGTSVTFTASLTPSAATGTVTFKDGSTTLGTGTIGSGQATFSTSALSVATHSITAVYSGDANYSAGTSAALSQVVNAGGTTTVVLSSANPSTFGTSVAFTASVTPSGATGTITFKDGSTTLGTGTLSSGSTTFSTSALSVATHSITAVYGGDANYSGSTSSAVSQVVNAAGSTTVVLSSANPSTFGTSVTFTASVTPSGATGTVTFKDGSTTLGTGTLSSGSTTFSTSALSVATHSITAVYGGDANYSGSTSSAVSQVVNAGGTTTVVLSSANPSTFGTSVTFTATVTPSGATGTITFKDGSTTLGTGTLSSGSTTFSTSALSVATHSITAVYGGDANYSGSTSSAVSQVVNAGGTTTVVLSSANPSTFGTSVTFTASVTPSGATGTITFKDGSTTLGTGTLSSGSTTFSTGALSVATHSITAVYGGDANYSGSTSSAVSQVVNAGGTTTVVLSSANPSTFGTSVTFTASVTPSGATGTITFKDGSTTLGTGTLSSGSTTFSTSALTGGTHSITAIYGGDSNYSGSTSSAVSQVVSQASTSISVGASANPSAYGTSVMFTATITPSGGTGSVAFKDGTATLGTGTIANGQATLSTSALAGGAHSITAVYGGDANYSGSPSSVLTQNISTVPLTITANDQSMTAGSSLPTFTVGYSGFVNGDSSSSLGGSLMCTTKATSSSAVGSYAITCSGQSSVNYAITYIDGTLTISPGGGGVITPGSVRGVVPGGQVSIPMNLVLSGGVSIDTLSFGLQITANGGAPAINTGTLTFTGNASLGTPSFVDNSASPNVIAVSWTNLSPAISGNINVGSVVLTFPAGATTGQTYTVQMTGASGSLSGSRISIVTGSSATLTSASIGAQLRGKAPLAMPVPASPGSSRRDRLTMQIRNERCAGIRVASASQSSCGGSADLEVSPVITAAGVLEVRLFSPNGLSDLGAMALSPSMSGALPDASALQPQGLFHEGHTYLVRLRNQPAYVRVTRIRSSVNPRLGAVPSNPGVGRGGSGRDVLGGDRRDQEMLNRTLSNAQITIDLELLTTQLP